MSQQETVKVPHEFDAGMQKRLEKARKLHVRRSNQNPNIFFVSSGSSKTQFWVVRYTFEEGTMGSVKCDCHDYEFNKEDGGLACKHILSTILLVADQERAAEA